MSLCAKKMHHMIVTKFSIRCIWSSASLHYFCNKSKRINCNFDNLLAWLKEFQFWPIYQIQLQNPAIPWWPSFDSKKVTCDDNSYQMCRLGPLNGILIDWKRTIVQRKGIESQFSKLHIMDFWACGLQVLDWRTRLKKLSVTRATVIFECKKVKCKGI